MDEVKKRWINTGCCTACYVEHYGKRPYALLEPELEPCFYCHNFTKSGIVVRVEVTIVP